MESTSSTQRSIGQQSEWTRPVKTDTSRSTLIQEITNSAQGPRHSWRRINWSRAQSLAWQFDTSVNTIELKLESSVLPKHSVSAITLVKAWTNNFCRGRRQKFILVRRIETTLARCAQHAQYRCTLGFSCSRSSFCVRSSFLFVNKNNCGMKTIGRCKCGRDQSKSKG